MDAHTHACVCVREQALLFSYASMCALCVCACVLITVGTIAAGHGRVRGPWHAGGPYPGDIARGG